MARITSPVVRHLTFAQGLATAGASVDLTLTGIVGARIAPTPALATLPFSAIFLAAGLSTFVVSRAIGRFGYRRVFIGIAISAADRGLLSSIRTGACSARCRDRDHRSAGRGIAQRERVHHRGGLAGTRMWLRRTWRFGGRVPGDRPVPQADRGNPDAVRLTGLVT